MVVVVLFLKSDFGVVEMVVFRFGMLGWKRGEDSVLKECDMVSFLE